MAKAYFQIILDDTDVPLTLDYNPAGIHDFEIKYKRSQTYGTVMRSISETLRFVNKNNGGYQYIKDIFDAFGIDGECYITLKVLDNDNKTYSTIYEGYLDFATYSEDNVYVEIAIVDTKDTTILQSREAIDIDLLAAKDLDGSVISGMPSQDTIELSPVDVVLWAVASSVIGADDDTGVSGIGQSDTYPSGTIDENFIGGDFDETTLVYTNSSGSNKQMIFKYNANSITFSGQLVVSVTPGADASIAIVIERLSDSAVLYTYNQTETVAGTYPFNETGSFSGSDSSIIPDGDEQGIIIKIGWDTSGGSTVDYDFDMTMTEYDMELRDQSPEPTSECFAFKPLDALTRALKVLGISQTPTSTVFGTGGDYELCYLTTGKRIRGFDETIPFNISFLDLFKSLTSIFGIWMDSDFNFDPHEDYLQSSSVLTITEFSDVEYKPANELYLSNANTGYEDQSYDESNGLVEYNTEFQYTTKNKSDNALDKISPVRADGLGIEYTRRKSKSAAGTEDTDSDNDIFIISCLDDAGTIRAEIGSDFTTVTGLRNSDQYYNFFLTPKRSLIRNGLFLNTSLNYFTKEVTYVKSKNNIDLDVDGVSELDGDYSSASSKTLVPIIMTFNTILTDALVTFLKTQTEYKLTVDGKSGYLMEADINLYEKSATVSIVLT